MSSLKASSFVLILSLFNLNPLKAGIRVRTESFNGKLIVSCSQELAALNVNAYILAEYQVGPIGVEKENLIWLPTEVEWQKLDRDPSELHGVTDKVIEELEYREEKGLLSSDERRLLALLKEHRGQPNTPNSMNEYLVRLRAGRGFFDDCEIFRCNQSTGIGLSVEAKNKEGKSVKTTLAVSPKYEGRRVHIPRSAVETRLDPLYIRVVYDFGQDGRHYVELVPNYSH